MFKQDIKNQSVACDEVLLQQLNVTFESLDSLRSPFIIFMCVLSLVSLISVLGNGLVIAAILKTPSLQKPSYLLISSMAAIDLILSLTSYPFFTVTIAWRLQKNIVAICRTEFPLRIMGVLLFV